MQQRLLEAGLINYWFRDIMAAKYRKVSRNIISQGSQVSLLDKDRNDFPLNDTRIQMSVIKVILSFYNVASSSKGCSAGRGGSWRDTGARSNSRVGRLLLTAAWERRSASPAGVGATNSPLGLKHRIQPLLPLV